MKRQSMKRALSLALTALGLILALVACTGTPDDQLAERLVIAEGATTLRTVPLADDTAAPIVSTPATTVFGLGTLGGATRVAVLFADRVEIRDANLNVLRSLTVNTFIPATTSLPANAPKCFTKLRVSESGARIAALYSCQSDPGNVNDQPTSPQRLALFNDAGDLLWARDLPGAYTYSAARTHLAVLNDSENTVIVARPSSVVLGGTDILRFNRNNSTAANPASFITDPASFTLYRVPPFSPSLDTNVQQQPVRDLAVAKGVVYAATANGVQSVPLTAGGALGTAVISGGASRVFSGQQGQFLAGWNADSSVLAVTDFTNSQRFTGVANLGDVTFSDAYMYVLNADNITRYEVARLGRADSPLGGSYLSDATDGRFLAFVVPPVGAP